MAVGVGFQQVRRSRVAGAAIAVTCALGALVSPAMAGRAAASGLPITGSVTDVNSCVETTNPMILDPTQRSLTITASTTASPTPHEGAPITLTQTRLRTTLSADVLQSGVDAGILTDGQIVPLSVTFTVAGSNTVEGSHLWSLNATAVVHVVSGVAQPLTATLLLADTTWQPVDALQPVVFTEQHANVSWVFNIGTTPITVTDDCTPSGLTQIVTVAGTGVIALETFSGTVIGGGGSPDTGASVSLIGPDGVSVVASTVTADDGSFAVDAPPAQYGLHIVEQDDAYMSFDFSADAPYVDLTTGSRSAVITMPTWSTLNVTVTSVNGTVAGATVFEPIGTPAGLEPLFGYRVHRVGGTSPTSCTTDATGTCSLPVFLGANAEVSVSIGGDVVASVFAFSAADPATRTIQVPSVPAAPTITSVSAGDGSVTVSFDPPGYEGQSPITGYSVSCTGHLVSGPSSPIVVPGLVNGQPYSCTVQARNSYGSGPSSDASASVVPASTPTAPTGVFAIGRHASADVSYAVTGNGLAVLDVTIDCTSPDGGVPQSDTTPPQNLPVHISGLTAGKTYTCAVSARNGLGSGPVTVSNSFVPLPPLPLPTITGLSKSSGPGAGGKVIAIRGKNFFGVTAVLFGDISPGGSITVNSFGTRILVTVPPDVAGTVDVSVTTDAGRSVSTPADQFTYLAPSVTRLSRVSGSHLGGTSVTIRGRNLQAASTVLFGSVPAVFVVNATGTRILAVAPAQATGTVDITVVTPGGTSPIVTADQFTFL